MIFIYIKNTPFINSFINRFLAALPYLAASR